MDQTITKAPEIKNEQQVLHAFHHLEQLAERAAPADAAHAARTILEAVGTGPDQSLRLRKLQAAMAYEDCVNIQEAVAVATHLDCYDFLSMDEFKQTAKAEFMKKGIDEKVLDPCFDFETYALITQGWDDIMCIQNAGMYVWLKDTSFVLSDYAKPQQGMTMQ